MRYQMTREMQKPAGAIVVRAKDCDALAYVYETAGKPYALVFSGKAQKPAWHYRFASEERRAKSIAEFFAGVKASESARNARRAAKKEFVHTLKEGDILRASWGYDQTNIDYYQVTRVIGKSVEVREIGQQTESTAYMQGVCVPAPNVFKGEPMRRLVQEGNYVKVSSCAYASPVKCQEVAGMKVYESSHWTAYA